MTIHILAEFHPLDTTYDEVKELLLRTVPAVTAEPGCLQYLLLEAKNVLVLEEGWKDSESLTAHTQGDAFKDLTASLEGKLSQPMSVRRLREVTA